MKTMGFVCLLFVVVGCTTAAPPGSFAQGVPTAPAFAPPAYAPAGTGAPVVGQPGQPDPPLLKTEPPFKAVRGPVPAPSPTVLGVAIPIPEENLERITVNQCLGWMHKAIQADGARRRIINAATEEKRRCMIHDLLAGCLLELRAQLEIAQSKGGAQFYPPAVEALISTERLAQRRKDRSCAGGVRKMYTDDEHDAWVQIWRAMASAMAAE